MQEATVCVFFCLNRGHVARDFKSKERGGTNRGTHFHHHLLHNESSAKPPTTHLTSATSALDKNSTMPVVRVLFKSANGKTRESNVLVDSGLEQRRSLKRSQEPLLFKEEITERHSCFRRKKNQQCDSRRMKVWISTLNGSESCPVEAHKMTIPSSMFHPRPHLAKIV